MQKRKKKSDQALRNQVWALQSKYIRLKDANFQGKTQCYTCYRLFEVDELNAGHYRHDSHDFDLRNIKAQCVHCNLEESGRADEFYLHLVKECGQKVADELHTRPKWNNYSRAELMELKEKYTQLLSTIVQPQ